MVGNVDGVPTVPRTGAKIRSANRRHVTVHDAVVFQNSKLLPNARVAIVFKVVVQVASAPGATESSTMVGVASGPATVKAGSVRAVGSGAVGDC